MMSSTMKSLSRHYKIRNGLLLGLLTGLLSMHTSTAYGWDFARVPLFWNTGVNPNVAFVADTSGSMQWMTTSEAYNRDMEGSKTYAGLGGSGQGKRWYFCSGMSSDTKCSNTLSTPALNSDSNQWGFQTPAVSFSNFKQWDNVGNSRTSSGTRRTSCTSSQTGVIASSNTICLSSTSHGFAVGDVVLYSGSRITGLTNGARYYVVWVSSNQIRLSASKGGAVVTVSDSNNTNTVTFTEQEENDYTTYTITNGYVYTGSLNSATNKANAQLCHVNKRPNEEGYRLGTGGTTTVKGTFSVGSEDIGVFMTNNSGSNGSLAPCVRFKEASTAKSPTTAGTRCTSHDDCNNYPESIDVLTPYLASYVNFLLNYHVKSSEAYNFSDITKYPDEDNDRSNFTASDYFVIPPQNRIQAMREGLQQVVISNNERMHIGLFEFYNGDRGRMLQGCDDYGDDSEGQIQGLIGSNREVTDVPVSATDGLIGGLRANGGTPLARTVYEAVAHLQGQKGFFNKSYTSPIKYRCQKNYVIALSDGDPSNDTMSSNSKGYNGLFTGNNAPNWDGIAESTSGNSYDSNNGYLDDIAQFAYGVDFKTSGVDAGGKSWNDQSFDKKWEKQNIETFTIGFALENGLLKDTPLTNTISIPNSDVDRNERRFKYKSHGLSTGDYILYTGTARGGFKKHTSDAGNNYDGKYYAVQTGDADYFRVASSKAKAESCAAGTSSDCLDPGTGSAAMTFSIGPGKSFFPKTSEELARDLDKVFSQINKLVSSASAVATNSKRLGADSLVYQARFNTDGWSGEIAAYQVDVTDGTVDTSENAPYVWSTNNTLSTASQRASIMTWNDESNKAVKFEHSNLSPAQQSYLGDDSLTQEAVVSWINGNNIITPAGFRSRPNGLLGDIINSDPVYVGAFNYGYNQLPASDASCTINGESSSGSGCTGAETYNAYVTGTAKSRTPMLYVGSNGGMLHGIVAGIGGGQERLAYIPQGVYYDWTDTNKNGVLDTNEQASVVKKFYELTQEGYDHRYFVDGAPFGGDAFVDNEWRSFVTGGSGTGGRSVYLIDVTDPDSLNINSVNWDFVHPELGYTMSNSIITRLPNGKWYSVFGNGLASGGDMASIFLVNVEDAADYIQLKTGRGGQGQENGMMTVQVRVDNKRNAIAIYGADMLGNIWRFNTENMTSSNPSAPAANLVFTAVDSGGNPQPITGGMRIGKHPTGLGSLIYFGTGKYFETIDKDYKATSLPRHDTFYAVLDDGSNNPQIRRQDLLAQSFIPLGTDYRTATTLPVDYEVNPGWYIDLKTNSNQGEKVVTTPVLSGSRIIFVSMLPSVGDRCVSTGSSWLNELDALTGAMLDTPPLDTNNDGRVNSEDKIVASALMDGYASEPLIISAGEVDYKLMGSTSTTKSVITIAEAPPRSAAAAGGRGRMSWQQLQ